MRPPNASVRAPALRAPRGAIAGALGTMLAAIAGCSTGPPLIPLDGARLDVGPRPDGGPIDARYVRPPEPVLPAVDLELVLPYQGPGATVTLEVGAALGRLDVAFSVDTTGSFAGEIDALQSALDARILPALEARVRDVGVGVARFEDFPVAPFGAPPGDRPFRVEAAVSTDRARARAGVAALSALGNGGDLPESGAEALYQLATGEGFVHDGEILVPAFAGAGEGGIGFRPGSLRVVVHVTDAPTHEPWEYGVEIAGTHSSADALAALGDVGARVIGVASSELARPDLEGWAIGTGAVTAPVGGRCATGLGGGARSPTAGVCPLVFDIAADGTGLSDAIVDAMTDLLDGISWSEAHGEAIGDDLRFVRAIEAESATPPPGGTDPAREDRIAVGDGVLDTFLDVRAGTTLRFVAHLANDSVEPADYEQTFRVTVRVVGDGLVLAERVVRVIVPAGRRDAGPLDAGTDAPI